MEAIQSQSKQFSLKQILKDNWCAFLDAHHLLVTWYAAYNVWKVINCREPDGLGYATYACPIHSSETQHVPHSCKSRFCSVCAKVQIDKWVTNMNQLFPNCSYFHITFTVPSQLKNTAFRKTNLAKCCLCRLYGNTHFILQRTRVSPCNYCSLAYFWQRFKTSRPYPLHYQCWWIKTYW